MPRRYACASTRAGSATRSSHGSSSRYPTQADGQGPDIGDQYRSEIFYTTPAQRDIALRLIDTLRSRGYDVVTRVTPATTFWPAEGYHQDYYDRKGTQPYCHSYTKRF